MHAAIGGITPTALPEVGGNIVELSPGDCHLVAVCGIDGDRAELSVDPNIDESRDYVVARVGEAGCGAGPRGG